MVQISLKTNRFHPYPQRLLSATIFINTTKDSIITIEIYINKFLGKLRLVFEEHRTDDEYRFWPDSLRK